jgi:hypothetical protein
MAGIDFPGVHIEYDWFAGLKHLPCFLPNQPVRKKPEISASEKTYRIPNEIRHGHGKLQDPLASVTYDIGRANRVLNPPVPVLRRTSRSNSPPLQVLRKTREFAR